MPAGKYAKKIRILGSVPHPSQIRSTKIMASTPLKSGDGARVLLPPKGDSGESSLINRKRKPIRGI